jgi:hypothetical protein
LLNVFPSKKGSAPHISKERKYSVGKKGGEEHETRRSKASAQ